MPLKSPVLYLLLFLLKFSGKHIIYFSIRVKLKDFLLVCEECDNFGVILYEDLACEAVNVTGKLCPVAFKCNDFKPANNGSCLFRKKIYNVGEAIPNEITTSYCEANCRCENTGWNCGSFDCPEVLNDYYMDDDCFYQYELNGCCSTKTICRKFEF